MRMREDAQDIRIFVSQRIDLDAELVDNPLYIPVRCGAALDKRPEQSMQGDNTGDHISDRRCTFNEFTVQYWAWKNVQADYYGLCHYRRYLGFGKRRFRTNVFNMVEEPLLTYWVKRRHGLLDERRMRSEISQYDLIVGELGNVSQLPTYTGRKAETVGQLWTEHVGQFIHETTLDTLVEMVDRFSPEYSQSIRAYFQTDRHYGYNCYIMKRDLFQRLCSFQFPILFALEKELPGEITSQYPRVIGYCGEILFGVFVYHMLTREACRVGQKQMVFVTDVRRFNDVFDQVCFVLKGRSWQIVRRIADIVLPVGTKRRTFVKKYMLHRV